MSGEWNPNKSIGGLWLLQRGRVSGNNPEAKVSENFSLDYMGSSEFEFGALPEALRGYFAINVNKGMKVVAVENVEYEAKGVKKDKKSKRLEYDYWTSEKHTATYYCLVPNETDEEVVRTLVLGLASGKHRMKEGARLEYDEVEIQFGTINFWMGVDVPFVMTRDLEHLELWRKSLVNSIKFMDEQKAKA